MAKCDWLAREGYVSETRWEAMERWLASKGGGGPAFVWWHLVHLWGGKRSQSECLSHQQKVGALKPEGQPPLRFLAIQCCGAKIAHLGSGPIDWANWVAARCAIPLGTSPWMPMASIGEPVLNLRVLGWWSIRQYFRHGKSSWKFMAGQPTPPPTYPPQK